MNVEKNALMFLVAEQAVFTEDYKVNPPVTQLLSGKVFAHASDCGIMVIRCSGDDRVIGFDADGMKEYLEYFDGYAGENQTPASAPSEPEAPVAEEPVPTPIVE